MLVEFDFSVLLFWLFAVTAIVSAFAVITVSNIIYSVLFLLLTVLNISGVWLLLKNEFLALLLTFIYLSSFIIIFILLMSIVDVKKLYKKTKYLYMVAFLFGGTLLLQMIVILYYYVFDKVSDINVYPLSDHSINMHDLGQILFNKYLLIFEIVGVCSLVVGVSAVYLLSQYNKNKTDNSLKIE